jgi:hypothetical protein
VSVTLNPAALEALLTTEEGPVGRFVADVAARVTAEAQKNVRVYFIAAPSLTVDQDIGFEMEGSSAVIGIRDAGSKARRLARGQAEGSNNWLLKALEPTGG